MKFGSTVLFVEEVEAVLHFYRDAFGCEIVFYDANAGFGELRIEGGAIGVASHGCGEFMMPGNYRAPTGGNPEGVEIAFYTEDVAGDFGKAVAAGAEVVAEPREMEWGQTVAFVRSIEGTVIGFCTEMGG